MVTESITIVSVGIAIFVYLSKKFLDKLEKGQDTLNNLDKGVAVLNEKIDNMKGKTDENSEDIEKLYDLVTMLKERIHELGNQCNALQVRLEIEDSGE
jgi:peptidoglycan hydrolase CwlO-like protein